MHEISLSRVERVFGTLHSARERQQRSRSMFSLSRSKHVDRREAIEEKNRDVRFRKSEITKHVVLRALIACFVTQWKVGIFKESAGDRRFTRKKPKAHTP